MSKKSSFVMFSLSFGHCSSCPKTFHKGHSPQIAAFAASRVVAGVPKHLVVLRKALMFKLLQAELCHGSFSEAQAKQAKWTPPKPANWIKLSYAFFLNPKCKTWPSTTAAGGLMLWVVQTRTCLVQCPKIGASWRSRCLSSQVHTNDTACGEKPC